MRVALFVDGSNYYYMQKHMGWRVDFNKLLTFASTYGDLADAYYYVGEAPEEDVAQQKYLRYLAQSGFTLVTKPIKVIHDYNTETQFKKANMDTDIVIDMFSTIDNYDVAILVSGDCDFVRALRVLHNRGKIIKVIATHGIVAKEMREFCGMHYIDFNNIRAQVERE